MAFPKTLYFQKLSNGNACLKGDHLIKVMFLITRNYPNTK